MATGQFDKEGNTIKNWMHPPVGIGHIYKCIDHIEGITFAMLLQKGNLPCTWDLNIMTHRTTVKKIKTIYTTASTYGCSLHYDGHYFRIFTELTLHPLHIPQEWIIDWNGNLVRTITLASASLHGPTGSCTDHRCDIVCDTEDNIMRFFDRNGKNVYNMSWGLVPTSKNGVCTDGRVLYILSGGNVQMSDKKGKIIRSWSTGARTAYDLTTDGKHIFVLT